MLLKRALILLMLCVPVTVSVGCGGHEPGVADAPEEAEPELTPEQEAAEREYNRSLRDN
jgi:hypothetical protein